MLRFLTRWRQTRRLQLDTEELRTIAHLLSTQDMIQRLPSYRSDSLTVDAIFEQCFQFENRARFLQSRIAKTKEALRSR